MTKLQSVPDVPTVRVEQQMLDTSSYSRYESRVIRCIHIQSYLISNDKMTYKILINSSDLFQVIIFYISQVQFRLVHTNCSNWPAPARKHVGVLPRNSRYILTLHMKKKKLYTSQRLTQLTRQ